MSFCISFKTKLKIFLFQKIKNKNKARHVRTLRPLHTWPLLFRFKNECDYFFTWNALTLMVLAALSVSERDSAAS